MLVHWIWLATRPGLNDREKVMLMEHFQDPEDLFFASAEAYRRACPLSPEGFEALQDKALGQAEAILRKCADKQIHVMTMQDAAYPHRLRNISDPPLVLYYKGRLPDFDGVPLIGVVGTRKATPYGITVAKRMGYQIAKCGGTVVSGMAFGIDGVAMQGALTAEGEVIGVLGCGADVVYPMSNRGLFADMEVRGCILSEFPPETPPYKWNFPKRNRIISGLCNGVLIVEAPQDSGALITARRALDQGRDVFVVPGNVDMPSCEGSNALLKEGAAIATCGWDVVGEYEALYPGKLSRYDKVVFMKAYPDEVASSQDLRDAAQAKVAQKPRKPVKTGTSTEKHDKKPIDNPAEPPYSVVDDIEHNRNLSLTETEQTVLSAVRDGEWPVDEVIARSGLPAGTVLAALTMLQIKGAVTSLPGGRICRKEQKP